MMGRGGAGSARARPYFFFFCIGARNSRFGAAGLGFDALAVSAPPPTSDHLNVGSRRDVRFPARSE